MVESAFHSHGPEDEVRKYYPSPVDLVPAQPPGPLLGQTGPYTRLLAMCLACDLAEPRLRTFTVVGPTGVGKTTAVRLAAAHANHHFIEVDLMQCGSVNRCISQVIERSPETCGRVTVLIQGLNNAPLTQLEELASNLDSRTALQVLRHGEVVRLPLYEYTWILEIGGLTPGETSEDPQTATIVMPSSLLPYLGRYVRFDPLGAEEIYAIVSTGRDDSLERVQRWLLERGVEGTFSEMLLRQLAQEAAEAVPYGGVAGVAQRLHELAVGMVLSLDSLEGGAL